MSTIGEGSVKLIGDFVYRHEDGREFRIKPERWSGAKHEKWQREGFKVIEVIGQRNADYHKPGANKAFQQSINPKPTDEEIAAEKQRILDAKDQRQEDDDNGGQ